jgi:hypothetical protein
MPTHLRHSFDFSQSLTRNTKLKKRRDKAATYKAFSYTYRSVFMPTRHHLRRQQISGIKKPLSFHLTVFENE